MPSFSFIHAADLHLDSPFSTMAKEDPSVASLMRSATFTAFLNIINLCIEKNVDFLLIAGDVFDMEDRSLHTQIKFIEGLKRLSDAGISTYIVHGNHDPLSGWASALIWPERVYVFKEAVKNFSVVKNNNTLAVIQGISYPENNEMRNLSLMFKRTNEMAFHIGLLHANAGADTGHEPYAPCTLTDLKKAGMDYWALGHVHERKVISEKDPIIIYPGNPQGRSIRETGERGCFHVTVDNSGEITKRFVSTSAIGWKFIEISACDLATEQGLISRLEQRCREISEGSPKPDIIRFLITGKSPLFIRLMNPFTLADIVAITRETGLSCSPFVWVEDVKVNMLPEIDYDSLIRQEDFTGELFRVSEELLKEDEFNRFIIDELSPLYEGSSAGRIMELPDRERLAALYREARVMCLDGLIKENKKCG